MYKIFIYTVIQHEDKKAIKSNIERVLDMLGM